MGVMMVTGNWEEECCQSYRRGAGRRSARSPNMSHSIERAVHRVSPAAACQVRFFIDQHPSFDETNLVRLFRFVQCNIYMVSMHLPHGSDRASAISSYIHFDANKLMIN